jgi:hypothetical protein
MDALRAASTQRTAHEIEDHGYHHVRLNDEKPYLPHQAVSRPKRDLLR